MQNTPHIFQSKLRAKVLKKTEKKLENGTQRPSRIDYRYGSGNRDGLCRSIGSQRRRPDIDWPEFGYVCAGLRQAVGNGKTGQRARIGSNRWKTNSSGRAELSSKGLLDILIKIAGFYRPGITAQNDIFEKGLDLQQLFFWQKGYRSQLDGSFQGFGRKGMGCQHHRGKSSGDGLSEYIKTIDAHDIQNDNIIRVAQKVLKRGHIIRCLVLRHIESTSATASRISGSSPTTMTLFPKIPSEVTGHRSPLSNLFFKRVTLVTKTGNSSRWRFTHHFGNGDHGQRNAGKDLGRNLSTLYRQHSLQDWQAETFWFVVFRFHNLSTAASGPWTLEPLIADRPAHWPGRSINIGWKFTDFCRTPQDPILVNWSNL